MPITSPFSIQKFNFFQVSLSAYLKQYCYSNGLDYENLDCFDKKNEENMMEENTIEKDMIERNLKSFKSEIITEIKDFLFNNFNPENFHSSNQVKNNHQNHLTQPFKSSSTFLNKIINSIVATNFFLNKNCIAFKLKNPEKNIFAEIFVYSTNFEGTHLRGGKISRGGIRWSTRNDYRTEIKDLAKTQILKNSIIVPTGAKGGFFIHNGNVEECYKEFISSLLDVTYLNNTNFNKNHDFIPKAATDFGLNVEKNVIKYSEHDSYLVVAADKGTASFSDIANDLSKKYGFWLQDAFASGGSNGYSHKALGITSKGCFESLKAHLNESKIEKVLTVIGIGDMSGDVFGNGLLLHDKYKLLAAFSSKFIFLDPTPNIEESFEARKFLFDNQLNWDKYPIKTAEIYSRNSQNLNISDSAAKLLGINAQTTPDEVIKAILKLNVDVMWSGGVGTFIKASCETHEHALDFVNDNIRINANELRAKILIEGANLSITQLGRIEAALKNVKLNTDFIDNSGGVNCSDLEVNIKILLYHLNLDKKDIAEIIQKLEVEVVEKVLQNNKNQNKALNEYNSKQSEKNNLDIYKKFVNLLIKEDILDSSFVINYQKRLELLQVDEFESGLKITEFDQHLIIENITAIEINKDVKVEKTDINTKAIEINDIQINEKFTIPELAIILSSGKIYLKKLIHQFEFSNQVIEQALREYYPTKLFEILSSKDKNFDILNNPIKHDIAINVIVNRILNKTPGPLFFDNLKDKNQNLEKIINASEFGQCY